MRRLGVLLAALLLLTMLFTSVTAASTASEMTVHATVNRDGSAQITLTAKLHLDQQEDLQFPVPADATNITLNGDRVSTKKSGDLRYIDLSKELRIVAGDVSISVTYGLPDVIHQRESGLTMELPLLSGFAYSTEDLRFAVTLPGEIDTLPSFSSGYHQASIEKDLTYTISGASITGASLTELKDHETLEMSLVVSETMFPQTLADTQDYSFALIGMAVCGALGLLYWFAALRSWPLRRDRSVQPPHGYTAGEMGCILNMQGADLSLSVLSWAQLGYILIHCDRHGKVTLHKRMDMGNERKESEQKLFKKLFGKGSVVDTTRYHYAQLILQARKKPAGVRELLTRRSGNPKVFRALCSGIGLFGGVCMAVAVSHGAVLQGLLIILLGVLGAVSGWHMQNWGGCILTGRRLPMLSALATAAFWILMSLICGVFFVGVYMVGGLLLAGVFLAWAGIRTDIGKQSRAQVLGLRRYLRRGEKLLLQRLMQQDPDYFFALAPYAMALGVGPVFARRFGKRRLQGCGYLTTGVEQHMTALEWMQLMEKTVYAMNDRARKLPLEKLMRFVQNLRK